MKKRTDVSIIRQGCVKVSDEFASVKHWSKNCIIIQYDLESKYAEIGYIGNGKDLFESIGLDKNKHTCHLADNSGMTYISFPSIDLPIFRADVSRYTLTVTFLKES